MEDKLAASAFLFLSFVTLEFQFILADKRNVVQDTLERDDVIDIKSKCLNCVKVVVELYICDKIWQKLIDEKVD